MPLVTPSVQLARTAFSWSARVDQNLAKLGAPPRDKLVSFITKAICPGIWGAATDAPDAAQEIVIEEFARFGWDVKENKLVDEDALSAESLQSGLSELSKRLRAGVARARAERKVEEDGPAFPEATPTEAELGDLERACQRVWDLDYNRLEPGTDYVLNLQSGRRYGDKGDKAAHPLFTWVDPEVFKGETYDLFIDLLDNYTRTLGKPERVTTSERKENEMFLNACMKTAPIKYCQRYLAEHGVEDAKDDDKFKRLLRTMWFDLYSRMAKNDSSGFEHVFVGEEKKDAVTGCHNWIQIYMEEKAGRLDYRGFIAPRSRRGRRGNKPDDDDQLISIQFEWMGDLKPIGSSFIGVSPEFELALYTMLFFRGGKETDFAIVDDDEEYLLTCKIYKWDNKYVATAFPQQR